MCGKYINMPPPWTPRSTQKQRDCDLAAAESWFYNMINSTVPKDKYSEQDKKQLKHYYVNIYLYV